MMESFNGGGGGGRRESTSTAGSSSSPSFSAAYGTTTATAVRAPARISVAVVSSGPSEAVQADNWTADPEPKAPQERLAKAAGKEKLSAEEVLSKCGVCNICCFPGLLSAGTALTVVGAINLDRCPAEPKLPFLMIGYGSAVLFYVAGTMLLKCCSITCLRPPADPSFYEVPVGKRPAYRCHLCLTFLFLLLGVAIFVFNIVFCAYVFSIWVPEFADESSPKYCERSLYIFVFIYLIFTLVVTGLFLMVCSCCCSLACCLICTQTLQMRNKQKKRLIPRNSLKSSRSRGGGSTSTASPGDIVTSESEVSEPGRGRTGSRASNVGGMNSDGSGPNIAVISHDDDGEEGRDQQHQPEPWFRGYEAQEDWRAEAARRADLRF